MPKLTINHNEIEVPEGITLIQACELAGVEIPRFCYHERLQIAGNCRMCLVEVEGGPPKPVASCAFPVADGQVVHTDTPMVKKAREGVMEFLLINHPLDCPICDQGGECDLQDQAMTYGRGANRFTENKRAVEDKYMGPLIKTHMTRCIHCTRCVRFAEDVAGTAELGAIYRGEDMQITTYLENMVASELSGNVIDLCPVGALTSKPYAFNARPWELRKTESIDVLDAVGSNIRVDSRGREVMRILPRLNEEINEEWISDKTRFAYDGLKYQRLDVPMIKKSGKLQPATWNAAFSAIKKKLEKSSPKKVAMVAGDQADCESLFALKALAEHIGTPHIDGNQDNGTFDINDRSNYLLNSSIAELENIDACLLIGANPRLEAPLVNTRLRKAAMNGATFGLIGAKSDLTYDINYLGDIAEILDEIKSGKHAFAKTLKSSKKAAIIIGKAAYTRSDAMAIYNAASEIIKKYKLATKDWNPFNILHQAASRVGALDLGFTPQAGGKTTDAITKAAAKGQMDMVYLLDADEIDTDALRKTFVVYQGHHGDAGAAVADVILPGATYTEKEATFTNMEGRIQRTRQAIYPPGQAKADWQIITELANYLEMPLPFTALGDLRKAMGETNEHYKTLDELPMHSFTSAGEKGNFLKSPYTNAIDNFYQTCAISRASKTMAECSRLLFENNQESRKAA